jgi:hypothetical protein
MNQLRTLEKDFVGMDTVFVAKQVAQLRWRLAKNTGKAFPWQGNRCGFCIFLRMGKSAALKPDRL